MKWVYHNNGQKLPIPEDFVTHVEAQYMGTHNTWVHVTHVETQHNTKAS